MPPSSHFMCCCRHVKKPPIKEGIQRSTEVGTMVLNMSGKFNGISFDGTARPPIKLTPPTPELPTPTPNGKLCQLAVPHSKSAPNLMGRGAPSVLLTNPDGHEEMYMTARTSKDGVEKGHMSMEDLIRTIRIEEGLTVSPREEPKEKDSESDDVDILEYKSKIRDEYYPVANCRVLNNNNDKEFRIEIDSVTTSSSHPKRAVFNENGDISARTNESLPQTTVVVIEEIEMAVYDRNEIPTVSARIPDLYSSITPSKSRTVARTFSSFPQAIVTAVTVVYTWCATFVVLLVEIFWK